jgi:RmuC family
MREELHSVDAVDAVDEAERESLLGLHAQQLRTHVKNLADKAYWDGWCAAIKVRKRIN